MGNMHLLEEGEAMFKLDGKKCGKGARRVKKVTERKIGNMYL
jgi:hypothetical protein